MKITAMQEYGLRCALQLAAQKKRALLAVGEIAKRERLTPVYVEKILVVLRRAGLVKSVRGVRGGYLLTREPSRITVAEILGALGQVGLGSNVCSRFSGKTLRCVHAGHCRVRQVWGILSRSIYGFLSRISLEQLSQGRVPLAHKI